jgi:hypothetical protein
MDYFFFKKKSYYHVAQASCRTLCSIPNHNGNHLCCHTCRFCQCLNLACSLVPTLVYTGCALRCAVSNGNPHYPRTHLALLTLTVPAAAGTVLILSSFLGPLCKGPLVNVCVVTSIWTGWPGLRSASVAFGFSTFGDCRVPISFGIRVAWDSLAGTWRSTSLARPVSLVKILQKYGAYSTSYVDRLLIVSFRTLADGDNRAKLNLAELHVAMGLIFRRELIHIDARSR